MAFIECMKQVEKEAEWLMKNCTKEELNIMLYEYLNR